LNNTLAAAGGLALLASTALAQAPAAPDLKTYASSVDVQALIAKARKEHTNQPTVAETILSLAPYRIALEYRTAVGPAAVHEKEAELFYVIEGTATFTTGGKLKEEKRANATNLTGSGVESGQSRTVAKGDFYIVPEGSPHQYTDIKGELILMSLHIPRG
jgi:mannose-6-phosphate isomerase-like protein (cupin superfamily)